MGFPDDATYRPRLEADSDSEAINQAPRTSLRSMALLCNEAAASQASGSAWFQCGGTQVVCGVYGPRERLTGPAEYSAQGVLTCELSFAPFAAKPATEKKERDAARDAARAEAFDISAALRRALEPSVRLECFPKSVLDLYITVLQDDGGVLPAAVTCAAAALASAGVELYDVAVSCGVAKLGGGVVLDPDAREEREADAVWSVTLLPGSGRLTDVTLRGKAKFEAGGVAIAAALRGCRSRHALVRETLLKQQRPAD